MPASQVSRHENCMMFLEAAKVAVPRNSVYEEVSGGLGLKETE